MSFGKYGKNLRKNRRAISPAISTVMMTAALVVLVLVSVNYANSVLNVQMAGDEFMGNKQFMQATGQQIDDVAWTIGRTETVQFTARYGQVTFVPSVLNYTFQVSPDYGSSWQTVYSVSTGMILFNMPVSDYSLGNNVLTRIMPSNNGSFLQWNASAPVTQVYAVQETPMINGSYARIVAVPTVRVLNSTLVTGGNYYKFYLPSLMSGTFPYLSQSVTLTGSGLTKVTPTGPITEVRITATALAPPSTPPGFNSAFFNFDHSSETVTMTHGSNPTVELYIGSVTVSLGEA